MASATRRPAARSPSAVEDRLHALGQAAMRLDQQDHHIGIRRPAPGRGHHGPVEPPARTEKARRVHEDQLRVALHRHAANARARGLHLVGHDRDLRAHHAVEQRRLARIGLSDQGDETGAGGHEGTSASRGSTHPSLTLDWAMARAVAL
jgi:hypothetical protein